MKNSDGHIHEKILERVLREVIALHDEVDARVRPLVARHLDRLQCRLGCTACCIDDLTVYEVEAERIRAHRTDVLESKPHPPGACAFLDAEGACRIYADRPYVCRTQGLPLRWFAEDAGGATVELRDICSLNESKTPVEALSAESCWLLGPVEDDLGELQTSVDAGRRGRVALRDLFQEKERIS